MLLSKNVNCHINEVIYNVSNEKLECILAKFISNQSSSIKNFGSSDCECESHLYYFKSKKEAIECVKNAYDSIAMDFEFLKK